MRTIGIRDLKTHLSQTLRDVQRGELYLVTDRGRVVAELRPPGSEAAALTPEDSARRAMLASGELRAAEAPRAPYRRSDITLPEGVASELLDWVRGER